MRNEKTRRSYFQRKIKNNYVREINKHTYVHNTQLLFNHILYIVSWISAIPFFNSEFSEEAVPIHYYQLFACKIYNVNTLTSALHGSRNKNMKV